MMSDDEEEIMNSSASRKCQRDQVSRDDDDGPPKQPETSPATSVSSSENTVLSPCPGLKCPEVTVTATSEMSRNGYPPEETHSTHQCTFVEQAMHSSQHQGL
ncbi:hypothetical protein MRX96_036400 [Rhipicephalus microplus]